MDIKNKKISDDEFYRIRAEVLTQWPTGKDVDFQEAVEYQKSIPEDRRFGAKLIKAKNEGRTLTQPRAGVALINEHIELLQHLQDAGEADLLPPPSTAIPDRTAMKTAKTASAFPSRKAVPCSTASRQSTTVYRAADGSSKP